MASSWSEFLTQKGPRAGEKSEATVRIWLKTSLRPTGTFISTLINVDALCFQNFESFLTPFKGIMTNIISYESYRMSHMVRLISEIFR